MNVNDNCIGRTFWGGNYITPVAFGLEFMIFIFRYVWRFNLLIHQNFYVHSSESSTNNIFYHPVIPAFQPSAPLLCSLTFLLNVPRTHAFILLHVPYMLFFPFCFIYIKLFPILLSVVQFFKENLICISLVVLVSPFKWRTSILSTVVNQRNYPPTASKIQLSWKFKH